MDIHEITTFIGWCSVINVGILATTVVALVFMRNFASTIHEKMFGIDKAELPKMYFRYIANYKIAILILNIVPYLALKILAV